MAGDLDAAVPLNPSGQAASLLRNYFKNSPRRITILIDLVSLANAAVWEVPTFNGGILVKASIQIAARAATGGKAATLTLSKNGVIMNPANAVFALTSATCTPAGVNIVPTTPLVPATEFAPGDTLGFVVSAVTAFVEGTAILTLEYTDA